VAPPSVSESDTDRTATDCPQITAYDVLPRDVVTVTVPSTFVVRVSPRFHPVVAVNCPTSLYSFSVSLCDVVIVAPATVRESDTDRTPSACPKITT